MNEANREESGTGKGREERDWGKEGHWKRETAMIWFEHLDPAIPEITMMLLNFDSISQ